MASRSVQLLCIAVACAAVTEARSLAHRGVGKDDKASLTPTQAKQFAADKRPEVDVLHFKHPYPVVQDTNDFDKDFVKDENADNGSYKAQMEYDRLRHLLNKQKQEVADALAKMKQEQTDVDEHNKLHTEMAQKNKETLAQKQAEVDKLVAEDKAADLKATDEMADHKEVIKEHQEKLEAIKDPKPVQKKESEPEPEPEPTKADVPQKAPEVEQAAIKVSGMGDAKDGVVEAKKEMARCQKELDEASAKLKALMESLAKAKAAHADAKDASANADAHETSVEKDEVTVHKKFNKESKEYAAAQKAYELQKERVEKLKRELKAAGKLVKGHRDDEDADGGVYNVPEPKKSAASLLAASPLLALFAAVAAW